MGRICVICNCMYILVHTSTSIPMHNVYHTLQLSHPTLVISPPWPGGGGVLHVAVVVVCKYSTLCSCQLLSLADRDLTRIIKGGWGGG